MFVLCNRCGERIVVNVKTPFCKFCLNYYFSSGAMTTVNDAKVLQLKNGANFTVRSLFHFNEVRSLILAAKIGMDIGAIRSVGYLIKKEFHRIPCQGARWVASVPQSFYSRVFGRFDLAFYMAGVIADLACLKVITLRPPFLWRVRKQSFLNTGKRQDTRTVRFKSNRFDRDFVLEELGLIVDDVVTSGSTMRSVAEGLVGDRSLERWQKNNVSGFSFSRC